MRLGTVVGYRGMRRLGLGDAYDARYRIYDAELRLFWSKDPLGWVDGNDRWAYVGGDPVNLWDPWGVGGGSGARELGVPGARPKHERGAVAAACAAVAGAGHGEPRRRDR